MGPRASGGECGAGAADGGVDVAEVTQLAQADVVESPPREETTDPKHCETFHAGDEAYAEQLWFWRTPIKECLEGRTDVECTDYAQWTQAWTEIKG